MGHDADRAWVKRGRERERAQKSAMSFESLSLTYTPTHTVHTRRALFSFKND